MPFGPFASESNTNTEVCIRRLPDSEDVLMKNRLLVAFVTLAACSPPAGVGLDSADIPGDSSSVQDPLGVLYDTLVGDEVPAFNTILAEAGAGALADSAIQDEPRYKVGFSIPINETVDLRSATPVLGGDPQQLAHGAVQFNPDGFVWSAVIDVPGATSLRLGLENLDLPPGAELYIYNDLGQSDGPYTGTGHAGFRSFFTQTLSTDRLNLQIRYTGADTQDALDSIAFTVSEVAYLDERFLRGHAPSPLERAHCSNLNDSCIENAECDLQDLDVDPIVQDLRDASAHMLFQSSGGWYICSGALIESLDGTTGHFLTANHCISTAAEAASLETYFQFTTPCPGGGGATTTCSYADSNNSQMPSSSGAMLIDSSDVTDFTLLKLLGTPPAGSKHLPFNTAPVATSEGAPLYRVSYPSGAPQAYSEHTVDSNWDLCGTPGDFINSTDVIGATEGGSSGSAVVNATGEIVGQLFGACGNNLNDVCDVTNNRTMDGAFAATWENSALVRNALAQEVLPTKIVLASHTLPSVSRRGSWTTSFFNDGTNDNLTFDLDGPNGDGDLYVKLGSAPTSSSYDCRPYLSGTVESCTFDPAVAGTYYVMVEAYSSFSGASLTVSTLGSACPDADSDGVCDAADACPGFNDGDDEDGDAVPDGCDDCFGDDTTGDTDLDGVCDDLDACVGDDGTGDSDSDGVCDSNDVCTGDDATGDSDSDGVCDSDDQCPGGDDAADADGDGVADFCDACPGGLDTDGDGVCDDVDLCIGDDLTGDGDGDGVCDDLDACVGNDSTGDSDGDGVCDDSDSCVGDDGTGDSDGDGVCNNLDACVGNDASGDSDNDGVCDDSDVCTGDDLVGDADGDGVCDNLDACVGNDASGDSDNDGVCDDSDVCAGDDGSGDGDGDGVCDDLDICLSGDDAADSDGDGVPDACDTCPTEAGTNADGCPAPACEYSDTISSGSDYYAIGAQASGTTISATLEWSPQSANLDLYLQYYHRGRWRNASNSRTSGFESVSYTVPNKRDGADFRWRVRRRSGTADYCLVDNL